MEKRGCQVHPPMSTKHITEVSMFNKEKVYQDKMMFLIGAKLTDIVKVDETIEDGLMT